MRKFFVTNGLLLLLSISHAATTGKLDDDTIVQLREGKIRGHILKSENGNDYYAFQEIPYAAPPVGENRLQLPKKVQPWNGILDTTKNTRVCYQNISKYSNLEIKEDCLYINVYTPLKPGSDLKKLPVLVWIHGGGYFISDPDIPVMAELDNNPEKVVPDLIHMSPENRKIAGQRLRKVYTKTSFQKDITAYCRWTSDNRMITPICKQAELIASEVPVYLYQFSYYGKLGQGPTDIVPGAGRVAHAEDLHYMWDDGSNSDLSKFPEEDGLTLHRFVKMWTNFVKYL
nr:pyrethroid hydrolase Ces2a-like [Leptinotarsa decemlineata]